MPSGVLDLLEKNWSGWKIVSVEDLRDDDQELWRKKWGEACPGVAAGPFGPGKDISYAFAVFRVIPKPAREALIVISFDAKKGFVQRVLIPPSRAAYLTVIYTAPAGTFTDALTEKTIRTTKPVLIDEAIEASAVAYYWKDDRFRMIQISE